MKEISIGNRIVGCGAPCIIAAEAGLNHNGDLRLAHQLIDAAADAGADAIKFQNYRTEDFLKDSSLTYEYVSEGRTVVESQYDMFKRCEVSQDWLLELREHCDRRDLIFFSTPTGEDGVAALVDAAAALLKNGSDYLVHLPLIRCMARTGLPTVLSTGMATLAEIDEAVTAFRQEGGKDLILLHCTSSYPTPSEDVHLPKIPALAAAFDCLVGFSDHTWGTTAASGAVALGACFVEKHFTIDRTLPGPDHRFSSDPVEFKALVQEIRSLERCLKPAPVGPTASESASRRDFRLSCVAGRDLPAGHDVTEADVVFRRPGTGLPPKALITLIGRRLSRTVPAAKVLELDDFV
jgi:N,N'-diacetyllegionaminate synthase